MPTTHPESETTSPNDRLMQSVELAHAFECGEEELSEFLGFADEEKRRAEEITTLRESLIELEDFDPEIQREVIYLLIDSVEKKILSPDDIVKLIKNISYSTQALKQTEEGYQGRNGAMTWSNFEIILHGLLKEKKASGEGFKYNIAHHLGHEIGHSVYETLTCSGSISDEEFDKLFDDIPIDYESAHTKSCKPEIQDKERFADLVGAYIASQRSQSPEESFIEARYLLSSGKSIANLPEDSPQRKQFLENSAKLFVKMDKFWKEKVRPGLDNISLEQQLETFYQDDQAVEFYEFADELDTSVLESPEHAGDTTASLGMDTSDRAPTGETPSAPPVTVGTMRDGDQEETTAKELGQAGAKLVEGFAEEVDILDIK